MSEPEKAVNLLWRVDEIIIALQQLRERLRRRMDRHANRRRAPKEETLEKIFQEQLSSVDSKRLQLEAAIDSR